VEAGQRTWAADAEPLPAARGKKLLELVQHLVGRGPSPEVNALTRVSQPRGWCWPVQVKSALILVTVG
jgi:hypothetical protein